MKTFPIPPTLFYLSVILMIGAGYAELTVWDVPSVLIYLGWLFIVAGIVLSFAGSNLFKTKKTNISTFKDPDNLVVCGPFKYTRNPMYLGMVSALLGTALVTETWLAFALLALFVMIVANIYIPFEEGRMKAVFGQEYDEYAMRVRRWI